MSLVTCPECGRKNVSDSAEACPECGYGIKKHFESVNEAEEKARKKDFRRQRRTELFTKGKKKFLILAVIIAAVMVLALIVFTVYNNNKKSAVSTVSFTAETLEELNENEEYAELYLGENYDEIGSGKYLNFSKLFGVGGGNIVITDENIISGMFYSSLNNKVSEEGFLEIIDYLSNYYGIEPEYDSSNVSNDEFISIKNSFSALYEDDYWDNFVLWYVWDFTDSDVSAYGSLMIAYDINNEFEMMWAEDIGE